MNLITQLHDRFASFLTKTTAVSFPLTSMRLFEINVDEQKQQFGDLTSTIAIVLAKELKQAPHAIAQNIASQFQDSVIEKIEVAGPGFINFFLTSKAFSILAQELFEQRIAFFKSTATKHTKINIEFVSANPTGPLHIGHGRGGIIGDTLGNVLRFLGHHVTKEFYVNDTGLQIKMLGQSLQARYQQQAGMKVNVPEDGYQGSYLIDLATSLFAEHGTKLLDQPQEFFASYAQTALLEQIKQTLADYGITYDVWFSEKTLHENGSIDQALAILESKGFLYEKENALWFTSTRFGDDKDRVIKKESGTYTYAAADIAYLQDKINRGHQELIYVLGHDHHSYKTRLHSMIQALGLEHHPLDVILYQLVSMKESGQQLRMSKRSGRIVTLQDVIDTVGKDIARFFYLNRKADAQLEFDIDLALRKTEENPVFYIQYAYVRTNGILKKAQEEPVLNHVKKEDLEHVSAEEHVLIKKIVSLHSILTTIEYTHHTHLLAYYTHELAQHFNRYYAKNIVIDPSKVTVSRARLALVEIIHTTLHLCLDLLGLSKPERM